MGNGNLSGDNPSRFKDQLNQWIVIAAIWIFPGHIVNAQVFDWAYNLGADVHPGTVPVPTISNGSGSALADFLAAQSTPTVKVQNPLSTSTATTFFSGPTSISNVFAGFENRGAGGDALTATQIGDLAFQVSSSSSAGASVSQFGLDLYHPDSTNPSPSSGLSNIVYTFSGVNTSSPILFPGSPTFRSPASGNSSAPNIRSSLFTIPLIRLSQVAQATPSTDKVIPFVSRFNSLGSPLVNSEFSGIPAWETTDQHLSRGDFQALMTHYRMRGADGVIAHDGGIVGYSREAFLDDTVAGWSFLDEIYPGEVTPVTLGTSLFEFFGFASSGVFGEVASGATVATLLLSNLRETSFSIGIPNEINGFFVPSIDSSHRTLDSNTHRLLTFWLSGDEWLLLGSGDIFELAGDSSGGIGIGAELFDDSFLASTGSAAVPVPAGIWFMISALAVFCRRPARRDVQSIR